MVSLNLLATYAIFALASVTVTAPVEDFGLEKRVWCGDIGSVVISYVNDIGTIATSGVSLGLNIGNLVVNLIASFVPGNIISGGNAALSILGIVDSSLGLAYGITSTAAAVPFGCFNGSPLTKRDDDVNDYAKKTSEAVEKGLKGGSDLAHSLIKLQDFLGGNKTDNNISDISSKGKVIVSGLLNGTKATTDGSSSFADKYGSNVTELENLYSQLL